MRVSSDVFKPECTYAQIKGRRNELIQLSFKNESYLEILFSPRINEQEYNALKY